jgi:hypothetical protein
MTDTSTPADSFGPLYLHAQSLGDFLPTLTLGRGWPTEIKLKVGNEEKTFPITYLDKDLIEEGQYVHPKTGRKVDAPRTQLRDYVDKFHRMQGEGIEVPIPCDHKAGSRDNLGFVKDARLVDVNGKARLRLTHALIGEDAALLATRNRASLGIDPNYIDGKGKKWGAAIVHSAITPDPVVYGMGSFTPALLSRGQHEGDVPVLFLSADTPSERSTAMSPELRKKFLALTGAAEDTTDDVLLSRVAEEAEAQKADIVTLGEQLQLSRTAVESANTERDAAKAEVVTLSRDSGGIDPELIAERSLRVSEKFDTLVGNGYTPAAVAKLKTVVLGRDEAPNLIALSRSAGQSKGCFADAIFDVLAECKPAPAPGERTGIQTLHRAADGGAAKPGEQKGNPWLAGQSAPAAPAAK